ncbi:MAG: 1-phosphofructokinase [Erysipelotrichaceae bacterium]|nr:1-phosphofructokinase [Erysipelotrichaceae bacterium]
MIYTVTLNPSLDYNISIENFKPGQINIVDNSYLLPGGKGINVAKMLNHFEHPVKALGFLAGFTGREIARKLESEGLTCDFIELENGISRINIKLKSEVETEINGLGPQVTEADIAKLMAKTEQIKDGDFLILSGSIPTSTNVNLYEAIIRQLGHKKVNVVIDARRDLLKDCLKYHPFLIKPNIHELGEIFNVKIRSDAELEHYAAELKALGAINVLVSLSKDGAFFLDADGQHYHVKAPQGILVNSVGAGDAMVAGFISGYLTRHDKQYALQKAVAAGSASAFSKGLATKNQVEEMMRMVEVNAQ